jgi:hypothetical protein
VSTASNLRQMVKQVNDRMLAVRQERTELKAEMARLRAERRHYREQLLSWPRTKKQEGEIG